MPPQTERFLIDSFKNDDISFFEPSSTPNIPSGQIKNYREDEMDIERIYQSDLESYKTSQEGLAEQDRLAEESFEKLFDTENIPNNAGVRRSMLSHTADEYVEGDYSDEEKKGIYKERLHELWSDLGKPLIEYYDTPRRSSHGGRWFAGSESDFVQPYKWVDAPKDKKVDDWNQYFIDLANKSNYEKSYDRHGKAEPYGDWDSSVEYRQDRIKINDQERSSHRWDIFVDELGHQMQGRMLPGQEIKELRDAAFSQRHMGDRYSNPKTMEHQAHGVYAPMLRKYLKGDDQYIDIIKSGKWGKPNTEFKHFKDPSLGLPKITNEYK